MPAKNKPINLPLAGRQQATQKMQQALDSEKPELMAVVGRRRVGKTYLIRHVMTPHLCFELSGARDAALEEQLGNFTSALAQRIPIRPETPANWPAAFQLLIQYLEPLLKSKGRRVIFFDELPWLARRNSRFLSAFEFFWNQWASQQPNLLVVVCGSATSWMITKILNNRGGLHNRVTRRITLHPFTLAETEEYFQLHKLSFTRRQIAELYMTTGGIPYYLSYIHRGQSIPQAVQNLIFADDAPLKFEFEELYASLFDHHSRHLKIVETLASKPTGLTRGELITKTKFPSGGNMTTILTELEQSGFILRTIPFGRSQRDAIYRLIDEFSLFYLRWVKKKNTVDWPHTRSTPAWQAWSGYAFENLCWRHQNGIQHALGISGIQCEISAWHHHPRPGSDEPGAQIDFIIHRKDDTINICEMKWSDTPFKITKTYLADLHRKLDVFRRITKTKHGLLLTMITNEGTESNAYRNEIVDSEILLKDLFRPD